MKSLRCGARTRAGNPCKRKGLGKGRICRFFIRMSSLRNGKLLLSVFDQPGVRFSATSAAVALRELQLCHLVLEVHKRTTELV